MRAGVLQMCNLDLSLFKKDVDNYWFYLFNDLLVYAERKGDSYNYKGRLKLRGMKLKEVADNSVVVNAFHITTPDKTITVSAPTKKDKKEWMDQIQDAISRLKETMKRFRRTMQGSPFLAVSILANEVRKGKEKKPFIVCHHHLHLPLHLQHHLMWEVTML